MNTGQTIFALFALALLGTVVVSMNRSLGNSNEIVIQAKLGVTAISIASSLVEEAQGKSFDKNTDEDIATATSQLTPVAQLGLETGEYYPDSLNDFDDFNNLRRTVTPDTLSGMFNISCRVFYIDPLNPNVAQASPTWHKKLSVQVTSPQMKDTVSAEYIFSYWYFR
ncbi:MAG: hypothetical protein HZB59_05405 [Ignavibacteriales bacterium]|nr:hypothetical protein [Ignavibacteriales bacterium]